MKLQLVPARTGFTWVQLGVKTFVRQPLALAGLFFMFMAVVSVLAFVPLVGGVLALVAVPALSLGLMAAAREADEGRFPMPLTLFAALRKSPQASRAMVQLGLLYAIGVMLVMGISALVDGGEFAQVYVQGGGLTPEKVMEPGFRSAMWLSTLLYLPVSLAFWHAPALVHWHDVAPVKSLFFSLVACVRNMGAFVVYGLGWLGVFALGGLVTSLLAGLLGGSLGAISGIMVGLAMVMATMLFGSIVFTFRDCFEPPGRSAERPDDEERPAPPRPPGGPAEHD